MIRSFIDDHPSVTKFKPELIASQTEPDLPFFSGYILLLMKQQKVHGSTQ
jgi:hypothetical protein